MLYDKFRTILLIQSSKLNNTHDICVMTGLDKFKVMYSKQQINYYSIGELVNALKLMQKVEEGIKIGNIDESISLDYILCKIL